ncbi:serine/threonine-protein kinase [Stieleria varia]|uniref:Serine/threonine-protein kinase PrkC n=1 Tax=Stieleria varia TaxID=2528005 RepID=A0A5C6B6C0_9BACT|nr:serine/threonine-protein kinase [Stieleria varia]TWU06064.1 Serine/threonine-protein kinase PrkC [Stieleria varia]
MNELQIFVEARDLRDPDQRSKYLQQATGGDNNLLSRVQRLLRFDDSGDTMFDRHPHSILGTLYSSLDDDTESLSTRELLQQVCDRVDENADGEDGQLGHLLHYKLLEPIGHGGFGVVVKALDEKLQRIVAIKILHPRLAKCTDARTRFLHEARSVASVRHDNIVQIYAVEESPVAFLVMEYIEGRNLQQAIDDESPLPTVDVIRIGKQIALALGAAFARGVIHRDIKPANILLQDDHEGRVKVTDFGLAITNDQESPLRSGPIAGTPSFMSPEQATGGKVDHLTDLFSLGCVLHAMCSGRSPFHARNALSILRRVTEGKPEILTNLNPHVPAALASVIDQLIQKNPAMRLQSPGEVIDALNACHSNQTISQNSGRNAFWLRASVTLAIVAAVVLGVTKSTNPFAASSRETVGSLSVLHSTTPESAVGPEERSESPDPQGKVQLERFIAEVQKQNTGYRIDQIHSGFTDNRLTGLDLIRPLDCSPLAGLTDLTHLGIRSGGSTHSFSLGFASGMRELQSLKMDGLQITTLQPLKGLPLRDLSMWSWNAYGIPALGDMSPLQGMPLQRLNCGNSLVSDLSPLRGMPLEFLCLNLTLAEDLTPLAGAPLQELLLTCTDVSDLTPLKGMPLKILELGGSRVSDLSPLAGSPIEILRLDHTLVTDFSVLKQMPNLKELRIAVDPARDQSLREQFPHVNLRHDVPDHLSSVEDGAKIRAPHVLMGGISLGRSSLIERMLRNLVKQNPKCNLPSCRFTVREGRVIYFETEPLETYEAIGDLKDLESLSIIGDYRTPVDVEFIANLKKLHTVYLFGCQVTNLAALRDTQLKQLWLWSWDRHLKDSAGDLSPLKGLSLTHLNCGCSSTKDLSPLAGMPLEVLVLNSTEVHDLSPLSNMPLRELLIAGTPVEDLSPLRGMSLEKLTLNDSKVTDLSPVAGMPIKNLSINGTDISDRDIISEFPLEELEMDYEESRDREWIASFPNLRMLNQRPIGEFLSKTPQ